MKTKYFCLWVIGDDWCFEYNPEVRGNIKVIHERKSSSAIEYQSNQQVISQL